MADRRTSKAGAEAVKKTAGRRRTTAPSTPSPHRSARARWALSLPGVLALGLAGWLLLPRLAASAAPQLLPAVQADWSVRLLPLLLALAAWILVNRRIDVRERAANARLLQALAAGRDPELKASLEEIGTVRKRLDAALAQLRRRRGGRYLYQLPWYLVIGAPGSGKTTALANTGLAAPLVPGTVTGPLAGLAGTRNCDWWFTDRAVLIDTAGRYTTQDSRRAVDGRVWSGLLDLLKEHRPRQPANGVLLTVSIPELTGWTDAERRNHAILIRQRLNELRVHLGLRLPVYLLLTKADLLDGFATFFDPLDREARSQVWGLTLPVDDGPASSPLPAFRDLYAGLVRRLDERLLDRLHQEPDLRRRSDSFALPLRVAELEPALADIVDTVFGSEQGEETPRLRGLYLTSATQTGGALGLLEPDAGASSTYFLDRLLPDIVFPEANLARVDRAVERARRRRAALSAVAALALGLAVGGWWLVSARGNAALLARADAGAAAVEAALRPLDTPPRALARVDDADPAAILPALDALRALPLAFDEAQGVAGQAWGRQDWAAPALAGGLYQGARIAGPAREAYSRALRSQFLARIALRLEERLRADWAVPDQLRQTLRVYRMVGGTAPMEAGALAGWLALDWQRTLPDPANEARRRALGDHLAALFAVGFAPVPPDEALLARVEEVLAQSASQPDSSRPASPQPDRAALP
ncbi:type VI secretion system membrane subunit TssM [Azospirillum sp. YIM B02556]|uniref:Type VI secretion system membrane subunit TssM n=1 Tax=Azospirillum endophyticum TaxID=2800326 RepID=A0ABS1FF55_9PROT|nr:type VI secretion system membrane subunit TssM [Azospirillum endophyticum]MBK1842063.1 type VI secretion system membrane subunit TssM [Azospirillum endophyticum]